MARQFSQTMVFACPECSYAFNDELYLLKHLQRSHDRVYSEMLRNGEIRHWSHKDPYCQQLRSSPIPSAARPQTTSSVITTRQKHRDTDRTRLYDRNRTFNHAVAISGVNTPTARPNTDPSRLTAATAGSSESLQTRTDMSDAELNHKTDSVREDMAKREACCDRMENMENEVCRLKAENCALRMRLDVL